jgi:hypothetical protein
VEGRVNEILDHRWVIALLVSAGRLPDRTPFQLERTLVRLGSFKAEVWALALLPSPAKGA